VALAPRHSEDADGLVHAADVAMYHAKRTASRATIYASDSDERRPDRLILRQELRRALVNGEIGVHYQPQVTPAGQMVGVEALVRWHHPARGLLEPADFLSISEEGDLMCELTDIVFELALAHAARWNAHESGVRVAVNLSAQDLRDPRLAQRVEVALELSGQPPEILTLEVTENALVLARDGARQLERIRAQGVRISLDDFGTGFGPLASLRQITVDELKIDRSFVSSIGDDPRAEALVGGLIRLGHDLGATIVAEGVETKACADRLGEMGCDYLQGYFIGRPRPDMAIARPTTEAES
jgi:diguanylate cyclase